MMTWLSRSLRLSTVSGGSSMALTLPGRQAAARRLLDIAAAAGGLVVTLPIMLVACLAVAIAERVAPIYVAPRIGEGGKPYRMFKLRSMVPGADQFPTVSTPADDPRITRIGRWLRRTKLDELPQLLNVIAGSMAIVGPRPQVDREVAVYTDLELTLLTVKPGIVDLASIVFSDLEDLYVGQPDPDLVYRLQVRPWKSRLGLLYIERCSLALDLRIVWLALLNVVSRRRALAGVAVLTERLGGDAALVRVATRSEPLPIAGPPGSDLADLAQLPAPVQMRVG